MLVSRAISYWKRNTAGRPHSYPLSG